MSEMEAKHTVSFEKAQAEYHRLPHVEIDPTNERTVADLIFRAEHEIEMHEQGEQNYTGAEIRKLRTFVKKWKLHAALAKAGAA